MSDTRRCGRMYGDRLRCRRLAGHAGQHALRLSIRELATLVKARAL